MTGSAMRVTILGSGGSLGVPMVGNVWGTCDPANPKNRRRRPSILVRTETTTILVDTSSDCRDQLLDARVERLDAVLYTHGHADHIHGIDDLRALTFKTRRPIPAYADEPTRAALESRFGYAVASEDIDRGLYDPIVTLRPIKGPIEVGDVIAVPFEQSHGPAGTTMGFRFGGFAYSTDVVDIDDAGFEVLEGVDTWVVDSVREQPHPTHAHLDKTLAWIARGEAAPRRAEPHEPHDGLCDPGRQAAAGDRAGL